MKANKTTLRTSAAMAIACCALPLIGGVAQAGDLVPTPTTSATTSAPAQVEVQPLGTLPTLELAQGAQYEYRLTTPNPQAAEEGQDPTLTRIAVLQEGVTPEQLAEALTWVTPSETPEALDYASATTRLEIQQVKADAQGALSPVVVQVALTNKGWVEAPPAEGAPAMATYDAATNTVKLETPAAEETTTPTQVPSTPQARSFVAPAQKPAVKAPAQAPAPQVAKVVEQAPAKAAKSVKQAPAVKSAKPAQAAKAPAKPVELRAPLKTVENKAPSLLAAPAPVQVKAPQGLVREDTHDFVISGVAYMDNNKSGSNDEGDTPIASKEITLLDNAGQQVSKVKTNASGQYTFTGLSNNGDRGITYKIVPAMEGAAGLCQKGPYIRNDKESSLATAFFTKDPVLAVDIIDSNAKDQDLGFIKDSAGGSCRIQGAPAEAPTQAPAPQKTEVKNNTSTTTNNNTTTTTTTDSSRSNWTCQDYSRIGKYNFSKSDPDYREALDKDKDGVACEDNEGVQAANRIDSGAQGATNPGFLGAGLLTMLAAAGISRRAVKQH